MEKFIFCAVKEVIFSELDFVGKNNGYTLLLKETNILV